MMFHSSFHAYNLTYPVVYKYENVDKLKFATAGGIKFNAQDILYTQARHISVFFALWGSFSSNKFPSEKPITKNCEKKKIHMKKFHIFPILENWS
jgi:hypothetical protein